MDKSEYAPLLIAWIAILIPLVVICWRTRSVGLVAAYCFQMWLFYWLGAMLHWLPWSELSDDEAVLLGFQQATHAMVAFAASALLIGPMLSRFLLRKTRPEPPGWIDIKAPRRYTVMGLIAYFILAPTIGRLQGMNAVPAVGSQLVVIGCCLNSWLAWHLKGKTAMIRGFVPSLLIPLVILMRQGFMSYGTLAMSIILLFIAQFFRPRWVIAVILIALAYPGLTVFVNYMRDRDDIRASVWGGEEVSDRMARVWQTVDTMEWFDPRVPDQIARIDDRLNQATLVGQAVDNLSRTDDFAHGETIKSALLGMIPRVIWPDKPPSGGSGGLAARFTGREFAVGTSIGVGPVLEFYGNFGPWGVIIGFGVLGALVRALDICAGTSLWNANWPMFTTFFLVGISCLNVSGSLVEVCAGSAASLVVSTIIHRMRTTSAVTRPLEAVPV